MTKHLKEPLGIFEGMKGTTVRKSESARFENTKIGICPVCATPMKTLAVGGIPAFCCLQDCVCVPTPNDRA